MSRRVAPPSGWPPPTHATLAGRRVELLGLAEAVADRYFAEFPDDLERYGDAARPWAVHDTLCCLHWAVLDVDGSASLDREIRWLANVLRSRGFPIERLARNLALAGAVVSEHLGQHSTPVAERLHAAADSVLSAS